MKLGFHSNHKNRKDYSDMCMSAENKTKTNEHMHFFLMLTSLGTTETLGGYVYLSEKSILSKNWVFLNKSCFAFQSRNQGTICTHAHSRCRLDSWPFCLE